MQETRRHILDILHARGEATVDVIVDDLKRLRGSITSVTVRHHLAKLQDEGLVDEPQMRYRDKPGRPRHIYVLSHQGRSQFPNNYQDLMMNLLTQMKRQLPASTVNVIVEGVADQMASQAEPLACHAPLTERLDHVVTYLNEHGYDASWQDHEHGYLLETRNCPYHDVMDCSKELCRMDMRLISKLLGVVPRLHKRISDGDDICAYLVVEPS